MKEKELRLALVCYGGISLAVYIHAATKEVLKLVRASRAYHGISDIDDRADVRYAETAPHHAHEQDSEGVYFELLKSIGKSLDLRVIVDVAAGASAGGINAVILARALAHDLPVGHLRDLWLKEADVTELLAREAKARLWSKWYLRPFIWAAMRLRLSRITEDRELRTKLSTFLRSRWFKPPFDGPHLSALLYDGIRGMGKPHAPGASLMPVNQRLELFVTVTDFEGYLRRIRLHDPPVVMEREHRHILRFAYRKRPDGSEESDLALEDVPALAFAGRASASFPGAFPPAQIAEMDRLLVRRGDGWPDRKGFIRTNFAQRLRAGVDPALASFIDGSVTNNKPFAEAIASVRERPAHRAVDRRLVYIDPHPVEHELNAEPRIPGFFRTLWGALSDIPRAEPIHDELAWINEFNARVRRMKTIVDAARPYIDGLVSNIAKGRLNRAPSEARLRDWRDAANALAAREAGFAYEGYVRLKLIDVLESVGHLIAAAHEIEEETQAAIWIVEVLNAWARAREIMPEEGPVPKVRPGARASRRPEWVNHLMSFDFAFRRRRLHFVIQRLNELYNRLDDKALKGVTTNQLDNLKRRFYEALGVFGRPRLAAHLSAETLAETERLLIAPAPDAAPTDTFADLAAAHALAHLEEIDALIERIADEIDLTEADRSVDDIFRSPAPEVWTAPVRRELLVAHIGFSFWDVLTFSVTQWRDLGEFDAVRVDRISPDDATALRAGTAESTLKGVEFKHFGAFFSRSHRENDYLWGRLHAADRLIDIVCDAAREELKGDELPDVTALKRAAFQAILDAEAPELSQCEELIAELRAQLDDDVPRTEA